MVAAGFSALINILYLAPTIYMMQVYDRVVPTNGIFTLLWITMIVALAIGTLAALDAVRSRLMARASLRLNRLLAGEILDRLMARPKIDTGDASTAQAMREFDALRQALGGPAAIALFDVPWTPLYVLVAFVIHPILGLLVIAAGFILVGLALANERSTKAAASRALGASASSYSAQEAAMAKSEVVRALGMRRAFVARQIAGRSEGLAANAEVQFVSGRYTALVKFFRMFLQSLALGVGAWLAVEGQISVGAIIAASVLLSRALQPVEQLVNVWSSVTQARHALASLSILFENTDSSRGKYTLLPDPEGYIELDRVMVRGPEGTMLLKGISTGLSPGEVLGVIGPSGAGKTTLARVVSGALAPDAGDVRIDEASFYDWDPELLARHIGYVPQDSSLLPGTIGENISRFAVAAGGDPDQVDRDIVRAAQMGGVHEMILHLTGGYSAQIGEMGRGLSAGQAQRVALARALYGDPKLLVLDEPNSALDAEGEEAFCRAISAAKMRGAAIMIIAHRAAILKDADRLLVLQDGAVAHQGPRDTVMAELNARIASPNVVNMKGR
jgi:ATP-binding cassette subfamily C protein